VPARNPDLHGQVPDKSDVAFLLVDVINDLKVLKADTTPGERLDLEELKKLPRS
jgi:hypothetical protein